MARFASRGGLHNDALTAGTEVLELRREVLGHTHPKTLTSWSNLIGYKVRAGVEVASADADALLEAWVECDPTFSDKAHLAARLQVAEALGDKGLALSCVETYTRMLGEDHPDTVRASGVVGSILDRA
jgi:hypothetical protein